MKSIYVSVRVRIQPVESELGKQTLWLHSPLSVLQGLSMAKPNSKLERGGNHHVTWDSEQDRKELKINLEGEMETIRHVSLSLSGHWNLSQGDFNKWHLYKWERSNYTLLPVIDKGEYARDRLTAAPVTILGRCRILW